MGLFTEDPKFAKYSPKFSRFTEYSSSNDFSFDLFESSTETPGLVIVGFILSLNPLFILEIPVASSPTIYPFF